MLQVDVMTVEFAFAVKSERDENQMHDRSTIRVESGSTFPVTLYAFLLPDFRGYHVRSGCARNLGSNEIELLSSILLL